MLKELLEQLQSCDQQLRECHKARHEIVRKIHEQKSRAAVVLKRFVAGDYIIVHGGRRFWANDGQLLQSVLPADQAGLDELVALGVIAKETSHRRL